MVDFLTVTFSAVADAGDFLKRLSMQLAGMSATNFCHWPGISMTNGPSEPIAEKR
jgi:hypothetical protein